MFERPHHQRIAMVLQSLDGRLLRESHCLFGGGTAIALRYGEYRESVDIDFLVSDLAAYSALRHLLTGGKGIAAITSGKQSPFSQLGELRADRYGIRTKLQVAGQAIKFEIVFEGRIELAAPSSEDEILGIATLTALDMVASKLLANSDRWADDGVFNRDLIDLAMMRAPLKLLCQAGARASQAYGDSIYRDLGQAIDRVRSRLGWLERCMEAMAMNVPKAQVWQNIRALRRVLPR